MTLSSSPGESKVQTEQSAGPRLDIVMRIVVGAVQGNDAKVRAYTEMLADELDRAGDASSAARFRAVLSGSFGARILPSSSVPSTGGEL